jgi:hypothetical protein
MHFKLLILLFSLTLISFIDSSFADQKQSQTSINSPAKAKLNEYVEQKNIFSAFSFGLDSYLFLKFENNGHRNTTQNANQKDN